MQTGYSHNNLSTSLQSGVYLGAALGLENPKDKSHRSLWDFQTAAAALHASRGVSVDRSRATVTPWRRGLVDMTHAQQREFVQRACRELDGKRQALLPEAAAQRQRRLAGKVEWQRITRAFEQTPFAHRIERGRTTQPASLNTLRAALIARVPALLISKSSVKKWRITPSRVPLILL
jgi:hypothetical protein